MKRDKSFFTLVTLSMLVSVKALLHKVISREAFECFIRQANFIPLAAMAPKPTFCEMQVPGAKSESSKVSNAMLDD